METFFALLAICAGNLPVTGEFPPHRSVTRNFDLRLNNRLNKQSWGWWFETLSSPLWRQCYEIRRLFLGYISTIPGACEDIICTAPAESHIIGRYESMRYLVWSEYKRGDLVYIYIIGEGVGESKMMTLSSVDDDPLISAAF